jgi:hypothetical protein
MRRLELPKTTFGIIVLNGEPFTRYNLRALYPFAHEIIVVEGAAPAAANIATPDGHSTDGTLEMLYRFKAEQDPENKVQIVVRDDFWSEKDEQSQAFAERATGDYLWQVDIDEFYKPEDMRAVLEMLHDNPEITAISFKTITFWGGFDYITDGWFLRRGKEIFHRLFKWGPGYRYVTHRPPTVYDPQGRDLRGLRWIDGHQLARRGILLYHYSLAFPRQVLDKCDYRSRASWTRHPGARQWAEANFMQLSDPFRVHKIYDYPSWLERFQGQHPPEIVRLQQDIHAGQIDVELRRTDDVEELLQSRSYLLKRALVREFDPIARRLHWVRKLGSRVKRKVKHILQRVGCISSR